MQKIDLNPLYTVEKNAPIYVGRHGYRVNVELYDTTSKVGQIAAYNFHPNKTTIWARIANWVIELIYGRTTVLVRVEGQASDLYVRVDDLSRILNMSSKSIVEESKKGDMTQFLVEHQKKQTINKIKGLVEQQDVMWTAQLQEAAQGVIKEIGYRHASKAMESDHFDAEAMALTLVEVGKCLANPRVPDDERHENTYKFTVALPNIFVWNIENSKKTTMNLADLAIREEDLLLQTAERIKELAQIEGWGSIEQQGIERLVKTIGYKNALYAIDCDQFKAERMARTLVKIGRELIEQPCADSDPQYKEAYQYIIDLPRNNVDLPEIHVWKSEHGKKINLELQYRTLTTTDLPKLPATPSRIPPASTPTSSSLLGRITSVFKSHPNEEKQGAKDEGARAKEEFDNITRVFQIHPREMKELAKLAKQVGYPNLLKTLGQLDRDNKQIMLNTFVEIGKKFSSIGIVNKIRALWRLKYFKGKKTDKGQRITHAFALNKKDIFIVQGKIGNGGFKRVSDAVHLNDLHDPFVRVKVGEKKGAESKEEEKKSSSISDIVQKMKRERQTIEELHKHKKEEGVDCIVIPFLCEFVVGAAKDAVILFQKKYQDGDQLKTASLFQKVHVLKDVARGLALMHKLKMTHMDVKPGNFLIKGDLGGATPAKGKVTDFGMTVPTNSEIPGGTYNYLPPEALIFLRGKPFINPSCLATPSIDQFSFGMTILESLTGERASHYFGSMNQRQIDEEIVKYTSKLRASTSKEGEIYAGLIDIARRLLKHNPASRMSCAEAATMLANICTRL